MATDTKKRRWFDLGAADFARVRPGQFDQPTYPCPICLSPFAVGALADRSLSVEHVLPRSFGGRELLLICRVCNNASGTKLDADARIKEDVRIAMEGKSGRPHRIRATIGGKRINGELHTWAGSYSLRIPPQINQPGTREFLGKVAQEGVSVTVQHEPFAELGAKISWFRSGYLALFAMLGYEFALDPATEIVRRQILECDERQMVTFTFEVPADIPFSIRRVLRILEPEWNRGLAVQFGPYIVQFPSSGDLSFYDRLAANVLTPAVRTTTYEYLGWPTEPTYGMPRVDANA